MEEFCDPSSGFMEGTIRLIYPKISKMDRTSILGDTIGYMKELLGRINQLEQENRKRMTDNVFKVWKESKADKVLVRNSPEFHVERRNKETAVGIGCGGMPGILLTTMSALEALGLEVEHCAVSCFNDFTRCELLAPEVHATNLFS